MVNNSNNLRGGSRVGLRRTQSRVCPGSATTGGNRSGHSPGKCACGGGSPSCASSGGRPGGPRSRICLDSGLLVDWRRWSLGVDRRAIRHPAESARGLGWWALGQARARLRLVRGPLALSLIAQRPALPWSFYRLPRSTRCADAKTSASLRFRYQGARTRGGTNSRIYCALLNGARCRV